MKKIVFLLFISTICFSQNEVDSLSYYSKKKDFDKAINYTERWIKSIEFENKEKDIRYLSLVCHLVSLYNQNNFKNYSKNIIEILENNLIVFENNIDYYRDSNYFLGRYYFLNDKFEIAQTFFNKTKELCVKKAVEDICYLNTLNYLYQIDNYFYQTNNIKYDDQKTFGNIVLLKKYFEEHETKNSEGYVNSINNLGLYYLHISEFEKAEKLLLEALLIIEKNNFNNLLIGNTDNLIKLYLTKFNYTKADYYNEITLKKIDKNHPDYLSILSNKALIKTELGNYKEAINIYDECIAIAKEKHGTSSELYGTMISNSVYPYLGIGDNFKKAEKLFLEDFEITKKHYGLNHIKTAMCYTRLGNIYISMKQDEKALDYFNNALEIFKILKIENIEYTILLSSIANAYSLINDNEKAEKYMLESYQIKSKIIDKSNISRLTILDNLCFFYLKNNKANEYIKYRLEYFEILKQNILNINSNIGEKESISYLNKILKYSTYLSFLNLHPNKFFEFNIAYYENQLLLKNLTLRNQQRIKNSIARSNNIELKDKYEQFIANKRYLTKQDELPLLERASNYETIKNATDNLEKDITRLSSEFADAKKTLAISWQDIQQKLKPNEVVIDLVSFNYYNKKWTDSIMYGAFVFTKNSKFPKYIHLFEEKELLNITSASFSSQVPKATFNALYANQSLTNLFLTPFKKELDHATTIYITPSGLTHQLNFEALPLENNLTLGKKYTLHVLNAASELINMKSTSISGIPNLECFLYGGIDFDKLESNAETVVDISSEQQAMLENVQRSGIKEFGYLKGTKQEVEQIATKTKAANFVTHLLQDRNASEESLKQLDGYKKPFVLHLATHGFFFPNAIKEEKNEAFTFEQKKNYYRASEDPMLRSGLVFAGANKTWAQKNTSLHKDDGIVTAKEISELDLSQCQLVVLSACETGLGTINGSEGVFGLQRAFKMAGVKNIIMSLWKVPDAQTAELFDIFYDAILTGKSIKEAFVNAQNQMQMKYEPYYWAGFILLE